MSFWDFSLENTGRTQIVSIQYQEQYGRAKKPVFMRVFAVSSVIPTLFLCLSLRSFNPSFYLFEVINPSIFMRIKLFQLFCVPFMYLEIRYLTILKRRNAA